MLLSMRSKLVTASVTRSFRTCAVINSRFELPTSRVSTLRNHHPVLRANVPLYYAQQFRYCATENADVATKDEIQKIVDCDTVVVFMKGEPAAPRCGFSNLVVQILRMHGVKYHHVDILEDERVRQGVKLFSDWPTVPQVYLKGEFIGGSDILLEMHQKGDLIEELEKVGIKSELA